jgi:hypothetical protein
LSNEEPISSANNEKVNIIKNCWKTNILTWVGRILGFYYSSSEG